MFVEFEIFVPFSVPPSVACFLIFFFFCLHTRGALKSEEWMAMTIKIIVRPFYIWSFTFHIADAVINQRINSRVWSLLSAPPFRSLWQMIKIFSFFFFWFRNLNPRKWPADELFLLFFSVRFNASLSASSAVPKHSWLTLKLKS